MSYEIQVTMAQSKETKNAIRYHEVDDSNEFMEIPDCVIGTLYVKKADLDGDAPENITVTVEWEEDKPKSKKRTKKRRN